MGANEKPEQKSVNSDDLSPGLGSSSTVDALAPASDNKDAVRAEIKEIESKLLKRKQKKAGKKSGTEIEDGECIDSEEDFDKIDKVEKVVPVSVAAPAPTPEELSKKKKEENKKRWGDTNKGSERDQAASSRSSEERGREKVKSRYSPTKKDRRESSDSARGSGGRGGYSHSSRGREGGGRRDGRPYSQYSSGGHYRSNYYDQDQRQYRY